MCRDAPETLAPLSQDTMTKSPDSNSYGGKLSRNPMCLQQAFKWGAATSRWIASCIVVTDCECILANERWTWWQLKCVCACHRLILQSSTPLARGHQAADRLQKTGSHLWNGLTGQSTNSSYSTGLHQKDLNMLEFQCCFNISTGNRASCQHCHQCWQYVLVPAEIK